MTQDWGVSHPSLHPSFQMGRALVCLDAWSRTTGTSIQFTKWMVLDFAASHPAAFDQILPDLLLVARGHGLAGSSIAELYARRRFIDMRRSFGQSVHSLVARGLIDPDTVTGGEPAFENSQLGQAVVGSMSSAYSFAVRAMASTLAEHWGRRNSQRLLEQVRSELSEDVALVASLDETVRNGRRRAG